MALRNMPIDRKLDCCMPVAPSPDNCDSALPSVVPVSPNTVDEPGGSVPPVLKKLLSALATFCWLPLKPLPLRAWPERRGQVRAAHVGAGVAELARRSRPAGWWSRARRIVPPRPPAAEGSCSCASGSCRWRTARRRCRARRRPVTLVRSAPVGRPRRCRAAAVDITQAAVDRERADRVAGRQRAAVDVHRRQSASPADRAAGVHRQTRWPRRSSH